jgi:aspartyl protease family protein
VGQLDRALKADKAKAETMVTSNTSESPSNATSEIGGVTALPKSSDGHFYAEARVNTTTVRFLVDTGASVVALTPEDARRLGVSPNELIYDRNIMTANGNTKGAFIKIKSMGVGQSRMMDVDALVVREGLSQSLLGMSYLGRLRRFEATPSSLILYP